MKAPVEPVDVVVNPRVELAVPPGGGVTVCGTVMLIPVGALPTQDVENVTGELKSPSEFTSTVVEVLNPCITETDAEEEATAKSGIETGAKTAGVPDTVTPMSVECATTPFVAVTMSV
jgi:hypothetical protein